MKSCNKKLLSIGILVLCVVSLGFVGVVSADVSAEFEITSGTGADSLSVTATADAKSGVLYEWTCTPSGTIESSSSESTKITFSAGGDYTVTLKVTNKTNPDDCATLPKTVTVSEPAAEISDIESVSIALDAPVKGATVPTSASVTGTGVTGTATVAWSPAVSANTFAANTSYTATIMLSADNAHKFTDTTPVTINGTAPTSKTVKDDGAKLEVTKTFSATEANPVSDGSVISSIDITITEPEIGKVPATFPISLSEHVNFDSIRWSNQAHVPIGDKVDEFVENVKYYAKIELSPKANYAFGENPTVTVNGKTLDAAQVKKNSGNILTVTVNTFDKTPETFIPITSVSVDVTAPAIGKKPSTEAEVGNSTYKVSSVDWYVSGTTTALNVSNDEFEQDTAYTVKVILAPASSKYIFESALNKSNAKINGNEVTDFSRTSNTSVTLYYAFSKTDKLAGPEITFSIDPASPKIASNANAVTVTYTYTITGNPTSATLYYGEGTEVDLGPATNGKITGSRSHNFNSLGSFTAYVTARNANGPSTKDITFSVGQDVLAAILEAGPLSGTAPLSVTCNDKSSGTIMTRTWNFGDGSVASHETSTSHTYTSPGTYTITLTVSDGRDTSTATKVITVTEAKKQETTTPEKEPKEPVDYEPFFTIGDVDVPSPVDLIAEFVRLFQSMFDFDNYHIFSNETTEDE